MTDLVVGLGSLRASSGLMNVGRTTLVGKFGPQIVELAGPSFVHTAAATRGPGAG
jgi:hypothetical protein